jgi:hypothetical protein
VFCGGHDQAAGGGELAEYRVITCVVHVDPWGDRWSGSGELDGYCAVVGRQGCSFDGVFNLLSLSHALLHTLALLLCTGLPIEPITVGRRWV